VSYDVDGLDWQDPPTATVVKAVLDGVRRGSIVSLHLGHQVTVAALPQILSGLTAQRLEPVTLSELLR
jgi:peptidoglycan/xylan/chitin deacetylase (PgdA/CDA1 family)